MSVKLKSQRQIWMEVMHSYVGYSRSVTYLYQTTLLGKELAASEELFNYLQERRYTEVYLPKIIV